MHVAFLFILSSRQFIYSNLSGFWIHILYYVHLLKFTCYVHLSLFLSRKQNNLKYKSQKKLQNNIIYRMSQQQDTPFAGAITSSAISSTSFLNLVTSRNHQPVSNLLFSDKHLSAFTLFRLSWIKPVAWISLVMTQFQIVLVVITSTIVSLRSFFKMWSRSDYFAKAPGLPRGLVPEDVAKRLIFDPFGSWITQSSVLYPVYYVKLLQNSCTDLGWSMINILKIPSSASLFLQILGKRQRPPEVISQANN